MAWYDSNWTKRKKITLTGGSSGAQTDYQVKLAVTYDSDMQSDFDDLRFTKADGETLLDSWLESKTDSVSAVVWVETNTPVDTVEADIYMYYGNSGAVSVWDIDATMLFGDDFPGPTIDTGKWTLAGSSFDIDSGNLRSLDTSGSLITAAQSYMSSSSNEILEAKTLIVVGHTNSDEMMFGIGEDAGRPDDANHFGLRSRWYSYNRFCCDYNGSWEIGGSYFPTNNAWFNVKLTKTAATLYWDVYNSSGSNVKSESRSNAFTNNSLKIFCNNRSGFPYDDQRWDHIFVRKYAANPATYAFGSEESAPTGVIMPVLNHLYNLLRG